MLSKEEKTSLEAMAKTAGRGVLMKEVDKLLRTCEHVLLNDLCDSSERIGYIARRWFLTYLKQVGKSDEPLRILEEKINGTAQSNSDIIKKYNLL